MTYRLQNGAGGVEPAKGIGDGKVGDGQGKAGGSVGVTTGGVSGVVEPKLSGGERRKAGLNYFRLVQYPGTSRGEGERAVAFLRSQGVDASLVRSNNGAYFFLYALEGFTKRSSSSDSYLRKLRSLGRLWKSKHKGTSHWPDIFLKKYTP